MVTIKVEDDMVETIKMALATRIAYCNTKLNAEFNSQATMEHWRKQLTDATLAFEMVRGQV